MPPEDDGEVVVGGALPRTSEDWPGGGLVEVLSRWEGAGGHWRILGETARWVTVGLFSCDGGEEMSRITGERTSVLTTYFLGRTSSC